MQTILIIENNYEDAKKEMELLKNNLNSKDYVITKLFDAEDKDSMQTLYNGEGIKEKVLKKN